MPYPDLDSQLDELAAFLPGDPALSRGSRLIAGDEDSLDQLLGKVLRFDLIDLDSAEYVALAR